MSIDLTKDEASKQDACWYVNGTSAETAWSDPDKEYFVVRNGEMKILYTDPATGSEHRIRYTSDFESLGIYDDKEVQDLGKDEEVFYWAMNPWFEVWSKEDELYFSEAIDTLDEAISYALDLSSGKEQK